MCLESGQINDKVVFFLQENETAIEFAARVKADICKKGGLVDLPWLVSIWWMYKACITILKFLY